MDIHPSKTGINRYWSTSITFTLSPSVFFFPTVSHFRNSWSGLGASFIHDINGLDMQRTLTFSGITPENSENWVKRWQTWFWRCLKDDSLYTLYSGTNPLLKIGDPFQILGPVLESNTSSPNIWHLTVPPEVADLSFYFDSSPTNMEISWNSHGTISYNKATPKGTSPVTPVEKGPTKRPSPCRANIGQRWIGSPASRTPPAPRNTASEGMPWRFQVCFFFGAWSSWIIMISIKVESLFFCG